MHRFTKQRALFKAYDIRGNGTLFTTEFIHALSHAFAQEFAEVANAKTVVIGYDVRHCSEFIAENIAECCRAIGIQVIWLGMVTTPVMAFWANQFEGHGIIATASHSESHISGVKWLIAGESPCEASIQTLYQRLLMQPTAVDVDNSPFDITDYSPASSSNLIALSPNQVANAYITSSTQAIKTINDLRAEQPRYTPKPLRVVIDCLNGATGQFAQKLFSQHTHLFSEVIVLNSTPNADFPKGNPDPMEDNRLTELSHAVIEHQADLGLAFDGDGDRLMVIDNQGNPLLPDHLLYLLARVAIEDNPTIDAEDSEGKTSLRPPAVIFDVKCSHHLPRLIQHLGATPQMSRTGSSVLRRALQTRRETKQTTKPNSLSNKLTQKTSSQPSSNDVDSHTLDPHVLFAGELSGHFLFNDGHFLLHDDAMYAALRLVSWLQYQAVLGHPSRLTDIISTLPVMVSTPDIYLPLKQYDAIQIRQSPDEEEQKSLISKLSSLCDRLANKSFELPEGAHLTCIDGLRLDFSHGFGIIRPSNTSNSLTVRFVGDSSADLKKVQGYFVKLCQYLNSDLAKQVANITVKS